MFDVANEELESEWNARFDYVKEAYAATELDAIYETWCDHCDHCEREAVDPGTYEDFERELREMQAGSVRNVREWPEPSDSEIPF